MVLYFLTPPYEIEEAEKKLRKFGFEGETGKGYDLDGIHIDLTDPDKGVVQFEGPAMEDLYQKEEGSSYYELMKTLAKALSAEDIVNVLRERVLEEILERQ